MKILICIEELVTLELTLEKYFAYKKCEQEIYHCKTNFHIRIVQLET
jgi:hypothetical protein